MDGDRYLFCGVLGQNWSNVSHASLEDESRQSRGAITHSEASAGEVPIGYVIDDGVWDWFFIHAHQQEATISA